MEHIIAMSGGVDSSVALLLTKNQLPGHIIGVTLALSENEVDDRGNIADARAVCESQGIKHLSLSAFSQFRERVIRYFTEEYLSGRTPSPCVICNREIKFALLSDLRPSGKIVTGHYARITEIGGYSYIRRAVDERKDQSYMLSYLTQEQIRQAHFPLGGYTKAEIREIAHEHGIPTASRRDSQDICFIPDGDYVRAIRHYSGHTPEAGDYLDQSGKLLGRHRGHVNYTVGQRKGLGIAMGHHVFVLEKDAETNTVVLGEEGDLCKTRVAVEKLHFPGDNRIFDGASDCSVKIRYAARPAEARFTQTDEAEAVLEFAEAVRAPAPGQIAVIYKDDVVVAAGVIK